MIANRSFDCIVLGAGPGGCAAAALVAEQGHSVLLVERDKMPRFHVGESLMPECYWIFDRLGIVHEMDRIGFSRKHGVQFVTASDKESKPFIFSEHDDRPSAESWHVQRDQLDKLLYDTAYNRGATCVDETRVLDIDLRKKGAHKVTVQTSDGKEQEIVAKVVIDASGQSSLIANRLQLKEYYEDLKKSAIWAYFDNAQRAGGKNSEVTSILHTASKDAWFWYIPLSDGTVSVGLVGDNEFLLKRGGSPQQTFADEMKNCPGIQRRLRDASQSELPGAKSRYNVAKEFSYKTKQQSGDGWVLVGDAGGFIDPLYSSGVFLALWSGMKAGEAVAEGLNNNDVSAKQLGRWTREYQNGVDMIRKLVRAFYNKDFSFAGFLKEHPQHAGELTDLLIGRVFEDKVGAIFDDMDPWIANLENASMS